MTHDIIAITVGIVLCFIIGWVMRKIGYEDGRHKERMHLIDIMRDIPTVVTTQEHVWYVVNYMVTRLREE